MEMNVPPPCPVCRQAETEELVWIRDVPIHCNVLYDSPDAARHAERGDVALNACGDCGMVYNTSFEPARMRYGPEYENALHYSGVFRDYSESLARRLIADYHLHNKAIVEIGCGDGHFLRELCRGRHNRGWGFDPSFKESNVSPATNTVTFTSEPLRSSLVPEDVALVCFRHVLEHVADPREFLGDVRRACRGDGNTVVFCEVPDAAYTFEGSRIWDILYEHCSYFSRSCLAWLFREEGFRVLRTESVFGKQYLQIEAEWAETPTAGDRRDGSPPAEMSASISQFKQRYGEQIDYWTRKLARLDEQAQRIVVWGAGTKGVSFLNMLNIRDQIRHVVDINPRKTGRFVPGTGQLVVAPGSLRQLRPDVVILMNPVYEEEVRRELERLSVSATILSTDSPLPASPPS